MKAKIGTIAAFATVWFIVFIWQRIFVIVPADLIGDILVNVAIVVNASIGLWFAMGRKKRLPGSAQGSAIYDRMESGELDFEGKTLGEIQHKPQENPAPLSSQSPKVVAYCLKEKMSFEMRNPTQGFLSRKLKNGTLLESAAIKGMCSSCGSPMVRMGQLNGNGQASPNANMVQIKVTRTHTGYLPFDKIQNLKLIDEKVEVMK